MSVQYILNAGIAFGAGVYSVEEDILSLGIVGLFFGLKYSAYIAGKYKVYLTRNLLEEE